jgi:hypothetical protein
MKRRLAAFGRFWWDFVVGDDLPLAVGAGATVGLTALLVSGGVNAWWLPAPAVVVLLALSVARAAHPKRTL